MLITFRVAAAVIQASECEAYSGGQKTRRYQLLN